MQSNPKRESTKYGWHGTVSSEGSLSLGIDILPADQKALNQDVVLSILAESIRSSVKAMEEKGYIPLSKIRLMSSREMSEEFGNSRQYWEKLLREGKIPFYQTAAGSISVDIFVEAYLEKKGEVDNYVNNLRKVVRDIKASKSKSQSFRHMACPKCGEEKLDYAWNKGGHEANGICRSGSCDFRFKTSIK